MNYRDIFGAGNKVCSIWYSQIGQAMRVSLRFLQRANEFFHLGCCVLRHMVADVSVGVEREGDGCMSE